MEELKNNKIESFGMFALGIAVTLYCTFLYYIIWGWFLEERFFEISIVEFYLGIVILRVMIAPNNTEFQKYVYKAIGNPSNSEKVTSIFIHAGSVTFAFGVLYIIHLFT